MAKGRKNGCKVNVKDWLIYILDIATNEFIRIFGLTSMERAIEGDTEDGSADTDAWAEPVVTKRSSTVDLEGIKKVVEATGALDPGQEMLDDYAQQSGCGSDATLKFVDPYGHGWIADYVITSAGESADASGMTKTWGLEQVGEAEQLAYVQVTGIAAKSEDAPITELAMKLGDAPKIIEVASNKRFRISNNRRAVVNVSAITESGFTLSAVGTGTATITVTSVNNAKVARIEVTVSAE